jgi:hypothetical protein
MQQCCFALSLLAIELSLMRAIPLIMFFLSKEHQSVSFAVVAAVPAVAATTEAIAIAEETVVDGREAVTAITTVAAA